MTIDSARDLQRWLDDGGTTLAAQHVRGVFARAPHLEVRGAAWISFSSAVGSGRLVRDDDGVCHVAALRHADGQRLIDRTSAVTRTEDLDELVALLSPVAPPSQGRPR